MTISEILRFSRAQSFLFKEERGCRELPANNFLSSQKIFWAPPRGFCCYKNIAPAFKSRSWAILMAHDRDLILTGSVHLLDIFSQSSKISQKVFRCFQ